MSDITCYPCKNTPADRPRKGNHPLTVNLPVSLWQMVKNLMGAGSFPTQKAFFIAAIEYWHKYHYLSEKQRDQFYQDRIPISMPSYPVVQDTVGEVDLKGSLIPFKTPKQISTFSVSPKVWRLICLLYSTYCGGFSKAEFYRLLLMDYCLYLFHTADFPIFTDLVHLSNMQRKDYQCEEQYIQFIMVVFGIRYDLRYFEGKRRVRA